METTRLEAFSDGVIAIIITIMVLTIQVPHGTDLAALKPLIPVLLSYLLSFVYVGLYWNNHHHLFYSVKAVSGGMLWANLHLLFWLSLIPFATGWMGENHFDPLPVAVYGFSLLMAAFAYYILERVIIWHMGKSSSLAKALGIDLKGIASLFIYLGGMGLSFFNIQLALAAYVLVATLWIVPDKRLEKARANNA